MPLNPDCSGGPLCAQVALTCSHLPGPAPHSTLSRQCAGRSDPGPLHVALLTQVCLSKGSRGET